ncbi:uncharacterized protein METZ01_LOCUS135812 [marine metagenome]|uniref:Uncharacterized protein n=1 Tax=marine metagenome TaxID=408172 RepID=A0A381Z0Y9_9ZZZZ
MSEVILFGKNIQLIIARAGARIFCFLG